MTTLRTPLLLLALALAPVAGAEEPTAPSPSGPVLTKPPELLQFVEAAFPPSEAGKTGAVVLSVTIAVDGTVEDAAVVESAGEAFDAAAVAAVRQFVFSPAEVDGAPSRIRILYRYEFVERLELPTTAIFAGVVRDRFEKTPLPGVTITLADGRSVVTDAEGRFRFDDVAPGTLGVTLQGERLTALSTEETFVAGERLDATYDVIPNEPGEEGDDLEIVVSAPTLKKAAVSTEVGAEEARRLPGTQGDVLRVVENLPGVARASLGTGALVVWGAAPSDTGVYVDGVRVPRLYHDGGLRSVIGSDFVRSVELVPGGYGAAYGRGLGGLVSVTTTRFEDEKPGLHGSVSADLYDAAASLHGKVNDRVTLGVGGRYGYVGPLLGAFWPGVEDFFPIPHYWDAQARVGVRLRPNETLTLTGLASGDRTERTAPNADPAREASEEKRLSFQRVMLHYAHDGGDGAVTSAVLYGGAEQASQVGRFGLVETSVVSNVTTFGARASHRRRVTSWLTVEGGLDAEVVLTDVARQGSVAVPSREGDVRAFGQPPPDQIASDRYDVAQLGFAPYLEADAAAFDDRLHVVAGLRLDPNVRSVSRAAPQVGASPTFGLFDQDFRAEPRLTIHGTPHERVHLTAAVGLYSQPPPATDLSASFGNPALPVSTGLHTVLGGGVKPIDTLSIDVTGFYTSSRDLPMRNAADQPARAEALVPSGRGRSYGGQLMVRLDPTKGFNGWISYTLARSERQDAPDRAWRPSDYDQRHVLTGLVAYALPKKWEVGLRARVATGFPRTEVTGAFQDVRRDLWQPRFGEHNELRLPTFFQADVRVAKHWDVRGSGVDLYLEIQNVTNQKNVEEYVYSADYGQRGAIRGLPILPVLGLRWSF